jgi:hypothetical protein
VGGEKSCERGGPAERFDRSNSGPVG